MQTNEELLNLANTLEKTLSSIATERKPAEKFLLECESKPRFCIALLQLLEHSLASPTAKFSAAVCFKNLVKRNWKVGEDDVDKIAKEDRDAVKQLIVDAMLRSPDTIQKQLSDALAIIGKEDFPAKWPNLVNDLVAKFGTGDFAVINGVLRTTHSLFKRFRYEMKSNELFAEIKFVLEHFAAPFTELFRITLKLCEEHRTNAAALRTLYSSLLLCSKIFYSLNYQDLPEFFEDNLNIWMTSFLGLLTLDLKSESNTTLVSSLASTTDEPGTLELIRAEICEIACLYAQKYDEEFAPHCPSFVTAVWNLLTTTGAETKFDLLVSNAIQLLAIVAERPSYKHLFEDAAALQSICERVVIPNMHLRDSDVEMFEDNAEEFIRRDLEHSDVDTRRRAACDLVRSLCRLFEGPVIDNFARYVSALLESYSADAANQWRSKDVALYLVTSLATRGSTERFGVTRAASASLVNLTEFARAHVLTELRSPATHSGAAIVKSACLKYVTVFRSQLPPEIVQEAFAHSIKFLRAPQIVLHTYACYAIERFFVLRPRVEDAPSSVAITTPAPLTIGTGSNTSSSAGGRLVVDKYFAMARLPSFGESTESLLGGLFGVLDHPGSAENEYAMKAIMRALSALQDAARPYLATVVGRLTQVLSTVARNPNKPHFNHCLFEALCVCVRQACRADPAAAQTFETSLFPVFEFILQNDVQDFQPYVFQLLAVLIEQYAVTLTPGVGPALEKVQLYCTLFPFLFADVLWDSAANQPALVRLLGAYCETLRDSLNDEQLEALLTLITKLMSSRSADHFAFSLLHSLVHSLSHARTAQFARRIFVAVFQRLTNIKTPKFVKLTITFFNLYIALLGADAFISLVDSLQPRLFAMVAERLIVLESTKITARLDRKLCAVGTTMLLSNARLMPPSEYSRFWPQLFAVALSLVEACANDEFGGTNNNVPVPSSGALPGASGDASVYDAEHFVEIEDVGCASAMRARAPADYQATFTPLVFAARKEVDTAAAMGDLRLWFARELARLAQAGPGRVTSLIQSANLQPAQLETLQKFLQFAGVQLV